MRRETCRQCSLIKGHRTLKSQVQDWLVGKIMWKTCTTSQRIHSGHPPGSWPSSRKPRQTWSKVCNLRARTTCRQTRSVETPVPWLWPSNNRRCSWWKSLYAAIVINQKRCRGASSNCISKRTRSSLTLASGKSTPSSCKPQKQGTTSGCSSQS